MLNRFIKDMKKYFRYSAISAKSQLKAEVERTGRPVKLPQDARPTPILIQNPNKENYVAIYTSMKQIPDTIKHDGCVQMKFDGCMNYAKQAGNTVHGVVVNPFTHNFIMKVRKEQKVTPEQFHMLARKNVEFVLFPHSIYSNGKDYFDGRQTYRQTTCGTLCRLVKTPRGITELRRI